MLFHLLVPVAYSVLFLFSFPTIAGFSQFFFGVMIGFAIFWLDRVLHVFFVDPEKEFHQLVRQEWKQKNIFAALHLLFSQRELQERLISRSVLFFLTYLGLTLFVLTSTGSIFGIGLVLGIGLHYCFDFWRYSPHPQRFRHHFLWQIKREWTAQEIHWFMWASLAIFILVSIMVLVRNLGV